MSRLDSGAAAIVYELSSNGGGRKQLAGTLSGGEQHMFGIARGLTSGPRTSSRCYASSIAPTCSRGGPRFRAPVRRRPRIASRVRLSGGRVVRSSLGASSRQRNRKPGAPKTASRCTACDAGRAGYSPDLCGPGNTGPRCDRRRGTAPPDLLTSVSDEQLRLPRPADRLGCNTVPGAPDHDV